MKKTINSLIGMAVIIIPMFFASCNGNKSDVISPIPPACTTCSSGTKLVISASVAPGQTIYVGDNVQINWTTNNIVATVNGVTGKSGSYSYGPLSTVGTTVNVSGITSDGLSDNTTVNVSAYTTKNGLLTKKVALYMANSLASRYVRTDSLAFPSAYHQGSVNSDTLYYKPDNTGKKIKANGNSTDLVWFFQSNETGFAPAPSLLSTDPDYWIISALDGVKFEIYQDKLDGYGPLPPGVYWRSFITYTKKAIP